jgi:opacity protein-like surface antigen
MKRWTAILFVVASAVGLSGSAEAQSWFGVGAGTVDPQGLRRATWFTANWRLKLSKNVVLEPEGGYWKRSETTPGVESSVRDVSVGVNILYLVPKKSVTWFAGAGVGAHMIRSEFDIQGFTADSDTELKSAIHLIGGLDFKLTGSLRLFGAVRFDTVSDVQQNKLYGGLRLKL